MSLFTVYLSRAKKKMWYWKCKYNFCSIGLKKLVTPSTLAWYDSHQHIIQGVTESHLCNQNNCYRSVATHLYSSKVFHYCCTCAYTSVREQQGTTSVSGTNTFGCVHYDLSADVCSWCAWVNLVVQQLNRENYCTWESNDTCTSVDYRIQG